MKPMDKYWESTLEAIPSRTKAILNEYLLSLKLENKAEATIKKYRWVIERFFSECSIPLETLKSEEVLKWLNEFSEGKKPRTVDLFLSALSSFFKFCLAEEYIESVIIKKRWRPKIPESLPKYLNEQEFARAKLAAEELSIRDRALVLFLFSSGCRKTEVVNLTIQDINIDRRTAEVKGKGKKIRNVHFSEECALVLRDYLRTRSGNLTEPLFMNRFGVPLQSTGIYGVIKKLGERAELTVRKWLATLEEKGLKPRSIHLKLSAVKSFYQYCSEENLIIKNPMLTVHTPKKDDSLPYYLTKRQVARLQELTNCGDVICYRCQNQ